MHNRNIHDSIINNLSLETLLNNETNSFTINYLIQKNNIQIINTINKRNNQESNLLSYNVWKSLSQFSNQKFSKQKKNDNDKNKNYNKKNDKNSLNNNGNIFKKINIIKMKKRRKNSRDTNASSTSYNSTKYSFIDEEEKSDSDSEIIRKEPKIKNNSINVPNSNNNTNFGISQECLQNNNNYNHNDEKIVNDLFINNTQDKRDYIGNPEFENTEILRVEVKLSVDKKAIFRLKRYDDVFETIKVFCEINKIEESLIKPLIIKSLCTLNTIYLLMNSNLNRNQYNLLKEIQRNEL